MRTRRTRIILGIAACLAVLGLSGTAAADQISSAIYIDVDLSGSMLLDTGGATYCYGDGSNEHPHNGGCVSRMFLAKNAMYTVVNGYPEVMWGLARFQQNQGNKYLCLCTSQGDVHSSEEPDSCDSTVALAYNANMTHDLPGTSDPVCVNYGGSFGNCTGGLTCCDAFTKNQNMAGADILVALAEDNESTILMWMDGTETDFRSGFQPGTGNFCYSGGGFGDCELRAGGYTPLAGSLTDLYTQLSSTDIGNDPYRGCRPYSVILLTDGDESCNGVPATSAGNLRSTPDLQNTCINDTQCPPNSWCTGGRCRYDVKTHVIGFALTSMTNANAIAAAGGTGAAIAANNEDDIVSAMAGIIAESIVQEFCNGVDDDCDGDIDEDFPIGQACNNGLPGVCYGEGTYICDPADDRNVICNISPAPPTPGSLTEICDGLDNDCDGEVDEGGVCTCNGPEICNGLDDYCGTNPPWNDGSEDPNVGQVCGTDVGRCTSGVTVCSGGAIVCNGVGPIPEVCDANLVNNDQNCNGVNNDGITPVACQKTVAGVGTCNGLETCDENGVWTCWAQNPAPEACNNFDDDCDGAVDENLTRTCQNTVAGVGTCTGVETCTAGAWVGCTAATPVAETCNNTDDDCDGAVDEGLTQPCQVTVAGVGTCTGIETCVAGSYSGCTAATPAAEICNNIDDDCDGAVDEGLTQACYSGPGGTQGVGLCTGGNQICTAGAWGACSGEVTPTTEVCDNLDNDCNGTADDGLGQTTCGLGVCQHTVSNCVGGVQQSCNPLQGAGTESCNNLDDDCDGIVDGLTEACYPFGTGCTFAGGVWTCQGTCATGTHTCPTGGGGVWTACQFAVGPGTEVCDGQDNDCDGQIDEGLTQACYPLGYGPNTGCTAPGSCVGLCQEGSRSCTGGAWGACGGAVLPVAEVCDGQDNDCDGQTDEGLSQACQVSNGFGTCAGVESCNAGVWVACNAATPAAETCNNNDDDCDGAVDENLTQSCYTGPGGTQGVGACHAGTATCTLGAWGACQGQQTPSPEVCDGIDNDCDGLVDEGPGGQPLSGACYSGPAGTEGIGVCTGGTRTCTGGAWGPCVGEVVPSSEQCNNLDDDCDTQVDENLGQTTCGLGLCQHTVDNCVAGVPQTCNPYQGAQPEVCDGVDNDCDGVIDGLARTCYEFGAGCTETIPGVWSCQGTCASGLQVCPVAGAGVWGECLYDVGPSTEVCDGLDNDCDGDIDEDTDGSPLSQDCYPPGSGPNTGCTFAGGVWTCLGLCQAGTRECTVGVWGTCNNHITPAVEVCDGSDNDCDGQIDEESDIPGLNQPCGTALGRCTPGILRCINSVETCEGGDGPFEGVCNGQDDDCDGEIDEPDEVSDEEGLPCGETQGDCEPGLTQCVGGAIQCVGGVNPSEEVCDGNDNDCDGEIDDNAVCPPNYWCVQADCRPVCDPSSEFPCPGTQVCTEVDVGSGVMEFVCLPDATVDCGGVTCPDGWSCVDDVCVDPCDGVNCQAWETCTMGVCIDRSCTGIGEACDPGEFCVNHECVADPCLASSCDQESEVCVRDCDETSCDYSCASLCTCPPGQRCEGDGVCVEDVCFGVQCLIDQRCNPDTGLCETNPCNQILCPSWQVCFEGGCIDNPCGSVICPPFYDCEVVAVESGGGTEVPVAQCVADTAYYTEGATRIELTALGSGGCTCDTGGAGDLPGAVLLLLMLLGVIWRSRRSARQGGAK